jgi:hypothetical protein
MAREQILGFLDSLRKPEASDPLHKWIGTYNLFRVFFVNTEQLCDPPLNDREFEKQWKCAIVFIAKNNGNGNSQTANGSATNTKEQDREHQQSQPKEFTVFKYSQDVPLAEEINLPV